MRPRLPWAAARVHSIAGKNAPQGHWSLAFASSIAMFYGLFASGASGDRVSLRVRTARIPWRCRTARVFAPVFVSTHGMKSCRESACDRLRRGAILGLIPKPARGAETIQSIQEPWRLLHASIRCRHFPAEALRNESNDFDCTRISEGERDLFPCLPLAARARGLRCEFVRCQRAGGADATGCE